MSMSLRRIGAMILRNWYLMRRSVPRLVDIFLWPTVNVLLWGFLSQFLAGNSSLVARAGGILLASMFLWEVMIRSQIGVATGFLEEVWSRNLGHMFVSPLRTHEWLISLIAVGIIRTVIALMPAALIAWVMYHFSIFQIGLPLVGFLACLMMMGWWLSLVIVAGILRFGQGAENLAWATAFVILPFSAVYYPVSVLPNWLQPVAWAIPSTHIFEAMRGVMVDHVLDTTLVLNAVLLNILYLVIAGFVFFAAFRNARQRGALLQLGE